MCSDVYDVSDMSDVSDVHDMVSMCFDVCDMSPECYGCVVTRVVGPMAIEER